MASAMRLVTLVRPAQPLDLEAIVRTETCERFADVTTGHGERPNDNVASRERLSAVQCGKLTPQTDDDIGKGLHALGAGYRLLLADEPENVGTCVGKQVCHARQLLQGSNSTLAQKA